MTNRKKSIRNLLSAAIGQLIAIAIGFMLPRLYIINFGSEVNGLLNLVNQILMYLSLFEAGVGAVTLQALYGPVARGEQSSINGILSATHRYYKRAGIIYLGALTAVSAVYPLVVKGDIGYITVFLVLFLSGLPSAVSFHAQAKYVLLLKAEGKNYIITNLAALITALVGLAKAALILMGYNVLAVVFVSFLIHLIQAVYITRYIKKHYHSLSVDEEPDYQAISQKNYMLVHQISGMIFQNTDILILSAVSGLKVVSVYSVYKLVMSQAANLTYIFQSSVDFVLGQTYHTNQAKYIQRIDLFESYFSALNFAMHAVIFYVLHAFVQMYTRGADMQYADPKLVYLFVAIELLTIMRMPMLQTINYAGHFKKTTPQTVMESIINVVVSLFAVYKWGIYGVLIGTIVALLYRTNEIIFYANRKLLNRSPLRSYLVYLLNFGAFALAQVIFANIFPPIDGLVSLIVTSALAAVISLPLFVGLQTAAWKGNRETALFYLKNKELHRLFGRKPGA